MILIVDDRPENLFALKSILELNSFQVDTAESGEEALRKILKKSYSLIILDVQMPQMDGFELAEMILGFSRTKDIPIIFLSAISKEKKFIKKGFESGGIDYITKPVDPDILLLKVKSMYMLSEQRLELQRTQEKLLKEIEIRKEAEAALATRMNELRSVMETLPQIAFTVSKTGEIEYVNSEWYLFSAQQGVFPEHHPDDGPVCDEWATSFKAGTEFVRELRIRKLTDENYLHYLLRIIPVRQEAEILRWVGAFSDIHQQKLANEILEQRVEERTLALMEKNRELEISNNELQQFAWVISHDLKEPVRKMMTFAHLIREKHLKDNAPALADFGRIIKSAERMSVLISDLLDFSQVSMAARFEETSLESIVGDVLSDYEIQVEKTGARITKSVLPVIEAVPSQMRQVFQNLVSNSLKFTQEGITPHIDITADYVDTADPEAPAVPFGPYVRVRFTDNGIGFEEKYLDKIFLFFQRLSHSHVYDGTGIGLAIAKKSIEKHNGTITARSAPGKGTSFLIVLPIKQPIIQAYNS